jgi:hypothetical protein
MSLASTGSVGVAYSIQVVTNLGASPWSTLFTTYTDTNGQFGFVDQQASNYPCRFYRSVPFSPGPLGGGLTAKGKIDLSGVPTLDSFNSSIGSYTNGVHGTNAVAMSNTNVAGTIFLNGGAIYGNAVTGPGGTVSTSGSAAVGDSAWVAGGHTGVQPGHSADNANFQFNDIAPPVFPNYSTAFTAFGTTNIAGTAGTATCYKVSTIFSSSSSQPLLIYGNVAIYCMQTGNNVVYVSGSGYIQLMPGSSLTLYTAGNVSITGTINGNSVASSCIIYGLPTCTSFTCSGNFIGVADVPEADITFFGSASVSGAVIAKTISASAAAGIHYDEALGGN